MADTQSSQSFHIFPEFPGEIRRHIWHHAIRQEPSRIVEVRICQKDHTKGRCYILDHTVTQSLKPKCCFHKTNPLTTPLRMKCRCTESQEKLLSNSFMGPHTHCVDQMPYSGKCDLCDHKKNKMSVTTIAGHTVSGQSHICPHRHLELSPLLHAHPESREEFLNWKYTPVSNIASNAHPQGSDTNWTYPVYFNFAVDTLATDWCSVTAHCGMIKGSEKIKSLLLTPPRSYQHGLNLASAGRVLDKFPSLEELKVVFLQDHNQHGPLTVVDLPSRIRRSKSRRDAIEVVEDWYIPINNAEDWIYDKDGFDLVIEMINLVRRKKDQRRVSRFSGVYMHRASVTTPKMTVENCEVERRRNRRKLSSYNWQLSMAGYKHDWVWPRNLNRELVRFAMETGIEISKDNLAAFYLWRKGRYVNAENFYKTYI